MCIQVLYPVLSRDFINEKQICEMIFYIAFINTYSSCIEGRTLTYTLPLQSIEVHIMGLGTVVSTK